jgi:hypothetical protein
MEYVIAHTLAVITIKEAIDQPFSQIVFIYG